MKQKPNTKNTIFNRRTRYITCSHATQYLLIAFKGTLITGYKIQNSQF